MKSGKILSCVIPFFLLAACATTPERGSGPIPQDHLAEIQRPDIPLVMNNRVQDWLDYFQGQGRSHFEQYLQRSGKYIPMMRKILHQHGLPEDLVYLSMIESGFNPHAYSRARATGAWQFIYQTGLRYGLRVNSWVDERRDPEKSTVAAAKYLKDLYDRYNNWYLAAASYNAGEGKIDRAIRKYDTEDFWELSKGRYLRAETKDYVPKLIAAALIAKSPEKYGFSNINYEEPVSFDEVTVDVPIDLRVVAKCAGVSYDEIKALNPELLHWVTPPEYSDYRLKIPAGTHEKFMSQYADLTPVERLGNETIEVKATTSLEKLARKERVHPVLLAAVNDMAPGSVVKAGESLILPFSPPEGESFYEKVYERRGRAGRSGHAIVYRVKNGDTISKISRHTGISVGALKKYNPHVNWSQLHRGQKLRLYASNDPIKSPKKRSGRSRSTAKLKRNATPAVPVSEDNQESAASSPSM